MLKLYAILFVFSCTILSKTSPCTFPSMSVNPLEALSGSWSKLFTWMTLSDLLRHWTRESVWTPTFLSTAGQNGTIYFLLFDTFCI